jgi:uncharacterized protein YdhG (YjbR/CyaY superfamily)
MKKQTRIPTTFDEYLAGVPEPAHTTLLKIRKAIRDAAPREAVETISYGMPAFKYKKILMWFAAFEDHCSVFPGASVVAMLANELGKYSLSKGTIRFPLEKPLPARLIKKLVKARLAEIKDKKL